MEPIGYNGANGFDHTYQRRALWIGLKKSIVFCGRPNAVVPSFLLSTSPVRYQRTSIGIGPSQGLSRARSVNIYQFFSDVFSVSLCA